MRERIDLAFHVMDREYGVTRLLDPEGKFSHFLYFKNRKRKVVYPAFLIWLGWPSCVGWDGCCLLRCLNCHYVICLWFIVIGRHIKYFYFLGKKTHSFLTEINSRIILEMKQLVFQTHV